MDRVEFFNKHASEWDDIERPDIDERLTRVVAEADIQPGQNILDAGTGTGVLIPHLLLALDMRGRILAVDVSSKMLDVARSKQFPNLVQYMEADVEHTDLPDESFDRVICNASFPHFNDRHNAIREMHRMLKPGGKLIISHPIGREAVNKLHKDAGSAVAEDRVLLPKAIRSSLRESGFNEVQVIDEPEFYLVSCVK